MNRNARRTLAQGAAPARATAPVPIICRLSAEQPPDRLADVLGRGCCRVDSGLRRGRGHGGAVPERDLTRRGRIGRRLRAQ